MKIRKLSIALLSWLTLLPAFGQQIAIPRIDAMPNKPASYQMLDWKQVAKNYDNFIFDVTKTGTNLPLATIRTSDGTNYADVKAVGMRTFVGHTDANAAEAINILPAVVGASLVGVDKTNHLSTDWVSKMKEFFNKKNGQNVYLNNYSAGTGGDWWYELMPNIYFYQLYSLYPNGDADFATQFTTVADRQLGVVNKLGGVLNPWTAPNMNHRAFNLMTGQPTTDGTHQPEAAGSIAWILHQAYLETGDAKYKQGAELALTFLQNATANPSYEIQLPYGIITAARFNAEEGTNFNVEKFMNWAFSSGNGTLRGWGTIVGSWNGYDMSGLIGEAKDGGDDYAFLMNGFQHAAALAPVVKYDKRYAKAIGKWMVNLASASRYFYPGMMPEANQESVSLAWSKANDPQATIPYESIKQNWNGTTPLAMGDALKGGWAATNLSLYSGSSVGYMASIISTTNVEGVLQIDLNKTDFGGENKYPNYLYYNPNTGVETINLTLPSGNHDVYDAISETVLKTNASGTTTFTLAANDVRLLVIYPTGSTTTTEGNVLKINGGGVVDYHSQNKFDTQFRIKSFSVDKSEVEANAPAVFTNLTENNTGAVTYTWSVNGTAVAGQTAATYTWTPTAGGKYKVKGTATNNSKTLATHEIDMVAIGGEFVNPEITTFTLSGVDPYALGAVIDITAASNVAPSATIEWTCNGGTLADVTGLTPKWTLPSAEGTYTLKLTITNQLGTVSSEKQVLVKAAGTGEENYTPIVYYPFNGNTKNLAQDALHATSEGAVSVADSRGTPNSAYQFATNQQFIHTANDEALNFTDKMSISFWMKPEALGTEQYVISHGSWEQRYKLSITPEKKLIMTLNTAGGIIDMADETPLVDGRFYHYAIVYTGSTLEIYRDGALVNSRAHTGAIGKSARDMTIGRMNMTTADYTFKGVIDEFRLYDVALSPEYVSKLPDIWDMGTGGSAAIEKLLVNGTEWDINKRYVLDCGYNSDKVNVKIEVAAGSTINIEDEVEVLIDRPAVKTLKFTVTSADGSESQEYSLIIERRFAFDDIVSQKWNNVLTVNNNSSTNGGYTFTKYKWFKDGVEIGTKQYYSAGKKATDLLDKNADYMVQVTTSEGEVLQTCAARPVLKLTTFRVYPNPVKAGNPITVEAELGEEAMQGAKIMVYNMSGILVHQQRVTDTVTTFTLNASGSHVLKLVSDGGLNLDSVIIVK